MKVSENPNERDGATAAQSRTKNSSVNGEPRTAQFNGEGHQRCPICDDPIGDRCFCKIHREEGGPIMLCCPSCTIQYIDSARPPADDREQELRAYEQNTHFFIGEDKPWL